MDWTEIGISILKIIAGIILAIIIGGSGLFGYIAWKAEARKWGGGMFAILVVCVILLYWLIATTFQLPLPQILK
ncbi:MAG: hypothetical protein KGY45_01125 [Hadesarchaea archaeon]|nr:hypothetical protein [Hadesarchaea archaeon]